ncbi:MAG: DUF4249 domain-containing protein [Chitinophagaceae bacterium]
MKQLIICCLLSLLLFGSCRERYDAPVKSPVTGYLVIEGVVNSGPGQTIIMLSRTTQLDNRAQVFETGATVKVEAETGNSYTLPEQGQGKYTASNLNLNATIKYRLHIKTKAGKDYVSDYVAVKNNPPIDSVSWKRENADGVQMYISTHDPLNNTRYYQWTFDETWQIQSSFLSYLKYKITIVNRDQHYEAVYRDSTTYSYDPNIINCWQYNSSTSLLLGSTAKLTTDNVYLPINYIPHGTIKLGVLYSINVKQYAWTKEGYEFLDKMRKNTEATGSIFDAQPSELKGNIRCSTDSSETVIGFFNVCPIQEKRIFISNSQVPSWGYQTGCKEVLVKNISDTILAQAVSLMPTVVVDFTPFGGIATFNAAEPACVDCTLRGSNVKPTYWP